MNSPEIVEVKGYLEGITGDGKIVGWAVNPFQMEEDAEIFIDVNNGPGIVIRANEFRSDLDGAGIRNGLAGFSFPLNEVLGFGELGSDLIIRAYLDPERSIELNNSPLRISINPTGELDPSSTAWLNQLSRPLQEGEDNRNLTSYFEGINQRGEIYGWAFDPQNHEFIPKIYLFIGDAPLGVCEASQFRMDLKTAGIKQGDAGFSFVLSNRQLARLKPDDRIYACFDAEGLHELQNTPFVLEPKLFNELMATAKVARLKRLVGNFEGLKENKENKEEKGGKEEKAQVSWCGWAHDPHDPEYKPKIFLFSEGRLMATTVADKYRGDLMEAGIADGKCAFSCIDVSFSSLRKLQAGKAVHAYFDENKQYELSGSPIKLDKQSLAKLWTVVLDPSRIDIELEEKEALFHELLAPGDTTDEKDEITATATYEYSLKFCREFLRLGEYELVIKGLTHELINERNNKGLRSFELILYRVFSQLESRKLSEGDLTRLDGAVYTEIREGIQKKELHKLYNKTIKEAFIQNFNQFFTEFYSDNKAGKDQSSIYSRYVRVIARCLSSIYGDSHLALSYLGLLNRDQIALKDAGFYALSGAINQAMGLNYEALQDYHQAVKNDSTSWRVYHEAGVLLKLVCQGRTNLLRRSCSDIVHLVCEGIRLNPHQSAGFKILEDLLRHFSHSSLTETKQLAKMGDMPKGLEYRKQDLLYIHENCFSVRKFIENICGLSLKNHKPHRNFRTIVFIASKSLWQCFYYRVKQKLDHARALALESRYIDFGDLGRRSWKQELMYADMVYLCRVPATCEVLEIIAYARSLEIPIVYDIDDFIFNAEYFPAPLESYAGTIDQDLHVHLRMDNPLFEVALRQADLVTCSTTPLAEQIRKLLSSDQEIVIYPNLLSEELYMQAVNYKRKADIHNETLDSIAAFSVPVEIFYGSATKAHKQIFYEVLCPALAVILTKNPQVRLTLVGYFELPKELEPFEEKIKILEPTSNYMGYITKLRQSDINLAILEQDPFTDCKSEIKWLEASIFGIPSIVTPTATYCTVLENENNALFAADTHEWIKQLNRLIQSESMRRLIGENAKEYALKAYHPSVGIKIFDQLFSGINSHHPNPVKKQKLLFVNVYFSPQSVGGATRIVESHVRYLMEKYSNEYELHVLTTELDPHHWPHYSVEQYFYGAALVTKLKVPVRNWADYSDEKIYDCCIEYFRKYEFDLIHFHSIQVLTASVVDAARDLKIPYFITLHDGWWLSKYLFLVDDLGELIDPSDPFSGADPEKDDLLWLLERRNCLYRCLHDAAAVLAVSEKFRQLHIDSGVTAKIMINENGVEPFEVLARISAPDQSSKRSKKQDALPEQHKVRVAHIGGISRHKGFHLFKEALTQGHFQNIEAIVIDHGLDPGEIYHDQWGTTPVTFRPKFKQSEVNRLYSEMDVLVAPSTWPESFGLVTREAQYAGVWVIASNRGAIGDGIVNDRNGWVISVDDSEELIGALQKIDGDPQHYRSQLASIPQRSIAHQVEECVSLYRSGVKSLPVYEERSARAAQ